MYVPLHWSRPIYLIKHSIVLLNRRWNSTLEDQSISYWIKKKLLKKNCSFQAASQSAQFIGKKGTVIVSLRISSIWKSNNLDKATIFTLWRFQFWILVHPSWKAPIQNVLSHSSFYKINQLPFSCDECRKRQTAVKSPGRNTGSDSSPRCWERD